MLDFTRLDDIRRQRPLVHCVSNIVSANDCANLALAIGVSPMMAQDPHEMEDITALSSATVLNTGTPSAEKFAACLLCGKAAQKLGQPVVLDPVGVGASPWRLEETEKLLRAFSPTILRVNFGEAQALTQRDSREQGVDSVAHADRRERGEAAALLSAQSQAAVLLSGPEDMVAAGGTLWCVTGGSDQMSKITGTGCMLSVLCGAFSAVEPDPGNAAALAAVFWKLCSQRAEQAANGKGPGTFRAALLDAAGTLTAKEFAAEGAARIEPFSL
jgi:hydroxyethylthiazole kinase